MNPTREGMASAILSPPLDPVRWDETAVRIIDQTRLPEALTYRRLETVEEVARAIETLAVRGAPAIGIAAAYGVALGARNAEDRGEGAAECARQAVERLRRTRPTAVNLFHALDRMEGVLERAGTLSLPTDLLDEAHRILAEDLETGTRIAEAGLALFPSNDPVRVLTHCNAGGLATSGWGTALAPVYLAAARGRTVQVFVGETRPLGQGVRLTAWELARAGIPVRVFVDGAAASVLAGGTIDLVIVGADRIAANGDTANKIGTFAVALAAREAGVPFYVAAPLTTFDPTLAGGSSIPVEERDPGEVLGPRPIPEVGALNPAFDITPASLITAWITDRGPLCPPFTREAMEEASRCRMG